MSGGDWLHVAAGGQINREDKCKACGASMLYHVLENATVEESFCGNTTCAAFLIEIEEPKR